MVGAQMYFRSDGIEIGLGLEIGGQVADGSFDAIVIDQLIRHTVVYFVKVTTPAGRSNPKLADCELGFI
jgi:hypothetical protein